MSKPALARYWSDTEHDGRGYLRPSTGEQVPGVTSITGMVDKDLAQWGANMTAQWVAEHWNEWNPGQRSEESAYNGARYKWREYRDERGAIGSNVHDHIEQIILGEEPLLDFLEPEEQAMVGQWEEFCFLTGVKFHSTEEQVWGDGYAGTLDARVSMYSERLGRQATGIVDWKTSKSAYWEYAMQLAALTNARSTFKEVAAPGPGASPVKSFPNDTSAYKTSDGFAWSAKNNGATSWWVEDGVEPAETAFVVHLRADNWAVYELNDAGFHMARFDGYKAAWWATKDLKAILGARGQKIDRPMNWVDPKWAAKI